jgi:hypothetical protein
MSAIAVFAAFTMSGCGGSSKPPTVAVTASVTTVDGADTVKLTATVTNDKGTDGVAWSVSGGGTLSDTTTTSATYTAPAATSAAQTVTVTATSVADTTKTGSATLTVPAKPVITPPGGAQLTGAVGAAYSLQLTGSGGIAPYTWTLTGGTLPTGWSLTPGGLLSGPAPDAGQAGTIDLTFTATDSGTPNALTATLQLVVTIDPAPAIVFHGIMPATVTYNTAYNGSAAATGGVGVLTYSLAGGSGPLPTGLSLNASTGAITGTPTAAAAFPFTIKASDAFGDSATQAYTITVNAATPVLAFAAIATQAYGVAPFTASATSASSGAVTYSVTSGPATINSSTGLVTLTGAGTVMLGASQAASGNYAAATASISFTVNKATATVTLGSLAQTYTGSPLSATATTNPAGLTVNLTYGGSSTAPTAAGSYAVVGTISDANYAGSASGTLVIGKATAAVTLGSLAQTYSGSPLSATATTNPAGLAVNFTYNGSSTAPTTAGSYTVVGTISDTNYAGTASGTLVIGKATATVTLGSLAQNYTGSSLAATATTNPAGLTVTFTYNGSSTAPTAVGSYPVVGTISDANYTGSASGTLVIAKGTATVTLGSLAQTYTGSPLSTTATTNPPGLTVNLTYGGSSTAPTAAGSYAVVGTISDANWAGSATGTLVIAKATATVTLAGLAQTYTGSPLSATASTNPAGLTVNITYGGLSTAPTAAGSYAVVGTISDANYQGSATGTLVIAKATGTVTLTPGSLTQTYTGSPLSATATTNPAGMTVNLTYNGSPTAPTAAGSYTVVGTINNANYAGSASGTLLISPAVATVTLTPSSLAQTYTGSPLSAAATTNPAGISVSFTYNGLSTAPTAAGSYPVVATISNPNYTGSTSGTLVISPATATVTLGSLAQNYNGSPLSATATTNPAGIAVSFTYNGLSTAPTAVGSYTVVGTINNANYTGSATGTLVISKGMATVTLAGLAQTYTGSALSATATTNPPGLTVNITYNGLSTAPTAAGSYTVVGTVSDPNYQGSATGTLVIAKASATVILAGLTQTYTGSPLSATATTNPAGLTVNITYNGSSTAPTAAGSYPVVGTISDPNYQGSASGTLVIAKASATVTLTPSSLAQTYSGSPLAAAATTNPAGLTVTFTYGGSPTAPTAAGSYAVVGTISDTNYAGTASGTLVISPATATVTLTPSSLAQTYTGSPLSAAATTNPAGIAVSFTYTGTGGTTYGPSSTAPTAVGSYTVVGTISNQNYTGSASGTLVISQATATVTLGSLAQTYNGSPLSATATTNPTGLTVTFTYNGLTAAPTAAGSYTVVGTINNANYTGSATGTLVISKAMATVTLAGLTQTYNGSPLSATATTNPTGLTVNLTYSGLSTAPTAVGSYTVVGTISDANYQGSATGTLVINGMAPGLAFTGITNKTFGNAPFTVNTSSLSSGTITFSLTSGFTSAGTVTTSGTVTLSGAGTVYLTASQVANGNYAAATATTSFTVYPTLTLTTSTLPTGVVGTAYNQSLVSLASGGDGSSNYSWSTTGAANLLTLGLTLNSNGTVTGTPTTGQTGTVSFPATVSDTAGNSATATMTVTINASLSVSTTTLPYGFTGTGSSYSQPLAAVGGTGTYSSWTVMSGGTQLAALNLSLNTSTGVISNTGALVAGSATFTVQVKDSGGATALSQSLTITIYNPLALPTPSASVPPPAIYGQGYSANLSVTGGSGNFTWTVTGLPSAGFTYSTNGYTMSISATAAPNTSQTIPFTVKVTDNTTGKIVGPISYSITVGPPAPLVLSPVSGTALPGATTGESYGTTINVSGGTNSGYAFSVGVNGGAVTTGASWTLPDNLTASSSGGVLTISGTPNATTPITLVVTATDSGNDLTGQYTYTLAVTNPPPLALLPTNTTLAPATIGQSYSQSINVTGGDQQNFIWTVNGTALTTGTPFAIGTSGISVSDTGGNTLSINGPATTYGTVTLNVSVHDVGTGQTSSTITYTIAVNPQYPLALTPNPNPLPSGTVNNAYSAQINASNGSNSGYAFSVTVGTTTTVVNAGMTVPIGDNINVSSNGSTLNISSASGTPPTQAADISFSVTLNDSAGDPSVTQSYTIAIINPAAGYNVSGTISYSGTKTGWIYVELNNVNCSGGCGGGLGTAIPGKGAYTIHGVPPGTYSVQAFMDTVGYGAENASDPAGNSSANVTVTTSAVTGANDTLNDPGTISLNSSPTWDPSQGLGTFSGGAIVSFGPINNNGVETPTSYTAEYSTSPTFATGGTILSGSQSFPATGGNSPWIVTGLTNGKTYYFRAAGVVGTGGSAVTGPYSAISPGLLIGAPSGNAVSGQVTFSAPTGGSITGPLYVGFYNQSTGQIYATVVGSKTSPPTSPASYSVNVPTGSNYFMFGLIDQNNIGLINAPGEISDTNSNNSASVVITGTTTNENLNLTPDSASSVAIVRTQNSRQTGLNGVTTSNYQLEFRVNGLVKLPVSVELATESTPGVVVPVDIATGAFNGNNDEFDYRPNLNGDIPAAGDTYKLNVTYSDGTSNSTANSTPNPLIVTVSTLLNAYPTNLLPTGTGVSTEPNFSWSYPSGASSSDVYSFQLSDDNGNTIWEIPSQNSNSNGFPSTMTPLIDWGIDPTGTGDLPSVPILSSESTYWWQITTTDLNGDEATTEVAFQTFGTPLSLPTTNPGSLPGATTTGLNYTGSVTVTGGVGPYNWQVNNLSDFGWYSGGTDNATLYISGQPNQTGTVTFQVTVTDSTGASYGPVTYTINVTSQTSGYYPVSGYVYPNACSNENDPPVTLTISGAGITTQTTASDGYGAFQFPSIPNGTYTITPSITGATSSAFVPASQSVTVNGSGVNLTKNFTAYLGYTVSGQVGYDGGDTGQIYLSMTGCGTNPPGTSISAPGAFTIRGVPPGNYTLNAWLDNKSVVSGMQLGGYGNQNASNPTGSTSNLLVINANVPDVSVGLSNPGTITLSSAPTWSSQWSGGFSGGALVVFSSIKANGIEVPTSYTLQYSTDSTFQTGVSSKSFPAIGRTRPWIVIGLTNTDTYYFRAAGVVGSGSSAVTGPYSAISTGILVGATPASGNNAVSGKVTIPSTITPTGPLYVGFNNQDTGSVYVEEIASPTNSASGNSYAINVPTGSNYFFFAVLDQNNDGVMDPGDVTNANVYNMITPALAIGPTTLTQNLTLPSANSWTTVTTENDYSSDEWGSGQGYGLDLIVSTLNKMPVSVALLSGSNVLAPADFAVCQGCGVDPNDRFYAGSIQLNSALEPTFGNAYSVQVAYSDGTSETLTPKITAVLPNYATNLAPAGPFTATNNTPALTWSYPATNAGSYTYQMWFADSNWNTVWSVPTLDSATNPFTSAAVPSHSITWGADPTGVTSNTPTVSSLTSGEIYYWEIAAYDANGNRANYLVDYVSGFTALALPAANPSSLGSATLNQTYSGSITATGGYGGYSYEVEVNGNSYCWGCNSISLGNGLSVTSQSNGILTITGTPNAIGQISFTVQARDSSGATVGPVTYTINIAETPVTLSGVGTITALLNQSFSQSIYASGGSGSGYTFEVGVNGGAYTSVPASPSVLPLADGLSANTNNNGTLTISGTPTSATTINLSVFAQDNQSNNTTQTDTIDAIAGPNGANNQYLSGTYVCRVDGFNDSDGSRWTSVSSFKANGAAGTITSGMWDTNGRDFSSEISGTATGTYSVGADNNGLMSLAYTVTSAGGGTGTGQYAIALNDTVPLTTATQFRMVEIDDVGANPSGQTGTGLCYRATTSVFGTDVFTGNSFVFDSDGENGSGTPQATLGRFVASGGSLTGGIVDEAKVTDSSVTTTTLTGGSYTTPDATNGRSTLTFTVSGGSVSFEVYVIDANRMFVIQTTDAKAQSGDVRKQLNTSTYTAANVNGAVVAYGQGYEYTNGVFSGYDSSVGQYTGNGAGVLTINQGYTDEYGNYQAAKDNGGTMTVNFDASNLGRATLTGSFPDTMIVYFYNTGSAFTMDFDTKIKSGATLNYLHTGWTEPQSETTFTYAAVAGTYLFGQLPKIEPGSNGNTGEWVLSSCVTGSSSCGFTGSVTTGGQGGFSYDQSIGSMTYNWDTTVTGTGSFLSGTGSKGLSCIVISATKDVCIFNGDDSPSVVILQQ